MKPRSFQKVAVMSRPGKSSVPPTLNALCQYLAAIGIKVIVESHTAQLLTQSNVTLVDADQLGQFADLLIVVGGDGNFINAAHVAVEQNLPILGLNRGRLGFLTDIYPQELESLCAVLQGEYAAESRFMLSATIDRQFHSLALNEVALLPGNVAHMIEFDIFINEEFVCSQRADGLLVSTPTGSTAYALSGGGPILHPSLDAIVLLPMFPHLLSSRPIVVNSNNLIRIAINSNAQSPAFVSCDGQERVPLAKNSALLIQQHTQKITLIHPKNYNYYSTLRSKLGWQNHL